MNNPERILTWLCVAEVILNGVFIIIDVLMHKGLSPVGNARMSAFIGWMIAASFTNRYVNDRS